MKHTAKFFVIAGSALLLTIVASGRSGVKNQLVNGKINVRAQLVLKADGGGPISPFPPGSSLTFPGLTLSADGGYPIPPFPSGSSLTSPNLTLSADGGYPIPPFPSGSLQMSALG